MRLKESRRVPMWNGPIECRLFRFDLVAGSARGKRGRAADAGRRGDERLARTPAPFTRAACGPPGRARRAAPAARCRRAACAGRARPARSRAAAPRFLLGREPAFRAAQHEQAGARHRRGSGRAAPPGGARASRRGSAASARRGTAAVVELAQPGLEARSAAAIARHASPAALLARRRRHRLPVALARLGALAGQAHHRALADAAAAAPRRRARSPSRPARPCARWPGSPIARVTATGSSRSTGARPRGDAQLDRVAADADDLGRPLQVVLAVEEDDACRPAAGAAPARGATRPAAGRGVSPSAQRPGRWMRAAISASPFAPAPASSRRSARAARHGAERRTRSTIAALVVAPPAERPREPGEGHELRLDQHEEPADEGGAEHLGGDDDEDAELGVALADHPEREQLERERAAPRARGRAASATIGGAAAMRASSRCRCSQPLPASPPQRGQRPPAPLLDEDDDRGEDEAEAAHDSPQRGGELHGTGAARGRRPAVSRRRASFAPRRRPPRPCARGSAR